MKNLLKKISPILALTISTSLFADYTVKIYLDPTGLNMNLPTSIVGDAQLNPSIINAGDSSTISWSYDYANEVEIEGLGTFLKNGTLSISPSTSRNYKVIATYGDLTNETNLYLTVVGLPVINTFNGPDNVFSNAPLNLNWTGSNISRYEIKSNNSSSGIGMTEVDVGSSLSTNITPTSIGTYTYTLSGYNDLNSKINSTKSVIVEADPTFTGFTVNGGTSVTVAPSTALTFAGSGLNAGSTLQGRNSANTADAVLPITAPVTAGTTTYYAAATKTLNNLKRVSALRSVAVTVVANPTIGAITAPTNVFSNAIFSMSWSGTNVVNYKIRSNSSNSGVSTSNIDLGTNPNINIYPTTAGTYTYTITATNTAGATVTGTRSVVVEPDPTFTSVTANGVAMPTSLTLERWAPLNLVSSGLSAGASNLLVVYVGGTWHLQGMNTNAQLDPGTYSYSFSVLKTLNGVTRYSSNIGLTVTSY